MASMWWHWVEAYIEEVDEDESARTSQEIGQVKQELARQLTRTISVGSRASDPRIGHW